MPTELFDRLSPEKRARVKEAIGKELGLVPIEEFSIRRVAHNAGIARGSFYQYFDGITDAIKCVLADYVSYIKKGAVSLLEKYRYNVFDAEEALFEKLKIYYEQCDEKNKMILRNYGKSFRLCEVSSYETFVHEVARLKEFIREKISECAKPDLSPDRVADAIELSVLVFRSAISFLFGNFDDQEEITRRFHNQLELIKVGLLEE